MSIIYDYYTEPRDDPLVEVVGKTLELALQELRPEVAAVLSAFPIRGYSFVLFWPRLILFD
jgi:hypothetical protein